MKSLIALSVIFSTVTALAVPHPHPEESKIDIATKLAAANIPPENDSDFLGKKGHIFVDEVYGDDSPEVMASKQPWHPKSPGDVANKRYEENDLIWEGYCSQAGAGPLKQGEANYIPIGNNDPGNPPEKRNDGSFEEVDADYLPWKKNTHPRDDGAPLLNECLWKFKKDNNCVEQSKEEKLRKRDIKADYEVFGVDEDYDGEVDFEYISGRYGNAYDEGEEEYLRRIYEGIHYDKYIPKRDNCRARDEDGDVDISQVDCDYSNQAEDDHHWEIEESQGSYYDNDDVTECEVNEVEDGYYPGIGIVGKSTAGRRHISRHIDGLPADNRYLCETTEDSPRTVDVVEIANIFKHQKGGERCTARNRLDSKCTKLGGLGSAQIAICTIHTGWFLYCDDVGEYALELSRRCKSEIDGIWRVGGTIFHESGKGSLIVY